MPCDEVDFLSEKTEWMGGSERTKSLVCEKRVRWEGGVARATSGPWPAGKGQYERRVNAPERTHLVRRVNKEDEPPRHVLAVERQQRDVGQEDGLKGLGDLEVVARREGEIGRAHV